MYGQVTKSYVSGYNRNRVHVTNLYAYEKRPLVADFNGAMVPERLIETATWQTWNNSNVIMSNPLISDDQRSCSIDIMAQIGGWAVIKCSVTLDDGGILVQQYRVNVDWAPIYNPGSWLIGPQTLTVTA